MIRPPQKVTLEGELQGGVNTAGAAIGVVYVDGPKRLKSYIQVPVMAAIPVERPASMPPDDRFRRHNTVTLVRVAVRFFLNITTATRVLLLCYDTGALEMEPLEARGLPAVSFEARQLSLVETGMVYEHGPFALRTSEEDGKRMRDLDNVDGTLWTCRQATHESKAVGEWAVSSGVNGPKVKVGHMVKKQYSVMRTQNWDMAERPTLQCGGGFVQSEARCVEAYCLLNKELKVIRETPGATVKGLVVDVYYR